MNFLNTVRATDGLANNMRSTNFTCPRKPKCAFTVPICIFTNDFVVRQCLSLVIIAQTAHSIISYGIFLTFCLGIELILASRFPLDLDLIIKLIPLDDPSFDVLSC